VGDQPETSQAGEIGLAPFNVLSLLGAIELELEELTPPPTVQRLQNHCHQLAGQSARIWPQPSLTYKLILALRRLSDALTLDSTRYIAISIVISTCTSKFLIVILHHRKQCLY
jgi:hypothetical protein